MAGFTNPSRAIYSTIRELIENSLDACEINGILPEVYLRISPEAEPAVDPCPYRVRIEDNGSGLPSDVIPSAFGQVLYGSKYKLRQTRGTFGLGGKMAVLYGQITTHGQTRIISSTGTSKMCEYILMMDIQKNRPIVLKHKIHNNKSRWHGTIVEFTTEADYPRAMPKILDYLKQTAIVVPYANLTFVDPRGRLYKFERATTQMPKPPTETSPHPHGIDIETLKRMIEATKSRTMRDFMRRHFQRVGETTAKKFLKFADVGERKNPRKLSQDEIVRLVNAIKRYDGFLSPDASCLSPLGIELLKTGIRKELNPEFVAVHQRRPAAYSGFPFIVEVGVAYGGEIPVTDRILLYRFANRIPLLFDEASDVSYKVTNELMNWRHYKVLPDAPIAVFVHICSLKIPYKTVGKEFIADRPEVEHEVLNALREVARQLAIFLSRKHHMEREKKRLDVFSKYLPKIAAFSARLAGKEKIPDVKKLLRSIAKYVEEGSEEGEGAEGSD
ncbi:DNA topoisomerase VI subunit B [Candidatus Bathyarchaeota archaeon]|nr:DNA topoisomerase VI subunit B [Candidatus Bathyarchaeota archaeon]